MTGREPTGSPLHPRRTVRFITVFFAALLLSADFGALGANVGELDGREPLAPLQPLPYLDPQAVQLGGQLFSDSLLSLDRDRSCVTCHDLSTGGTVHIPRPIGQTGKVYLFNTPTVFNVGSNYRLGWRGGLTSLERQTDKILLDKDLMAMTWPTLIKRLGQSAAYSASFDRVYGRPPDQNSVLDALSSYQRSLATPASAFDRYLNGDPNALSRMQLQGYQLFKDYGCASCHQGSNVGGNMFQRFGIFAEPPGTFAAGDGDLGRFKLTARESDKGVFRVPSLRNVAVTGPYFHDGRASTLAQAVEVMGTSQLGRSLTRREIDNLVAFLETLTGEYNGSKLGTPAPTRRD